MITEEILREVIKENDFSISKKETIKREKELPLISDSVIVVTGIRRCGKSTILQQLLKRVKKKVFLNFEDTRLEGFELSDFQKLEKIAIAEKINCYIFDEIQNIHQWEKYVRSSHDKGFQIFITGSNAAMLSRELGTKLTGRNIQTELFPFNYLEYLRFKKEKPSVISSKNYLTNGGFPEYLISTDPEYLRNLLRDIVIRDIAVRRNIKNEHIILRLALYLISNVGKEVSYNKISKIIGIKSVRTTINYCDFLKESYLLDFIPRFSYSIKQQQINPKKVYAIDTGMARANSLSFSEDDGRILENAVFIRLRQHSQDILFFRDEQSECDFLVRKNDKIIFVAQVCWHLTENNLKRELLGLQNAMSVTGVKNGIIITFNQEDTFGKIKAIPFWKWMQNNIF